MLTADHPDPDDLVVRAALGEPLSDEERSLLASDPALQAEVDELAAVVALADDPVDGPAPAHLWDAIAAEAFGHPMEQPAGNDPTADRAASDVAGVPATPGPDAQHGSGAQVIAMPSRGWRRMTTVGLVAAAAVAVGVVVIGPGLLPDDPVEPIAAATLEPFGDHQVESTSGQVVRTADGHTLLELDLSALPALEGDFYEVWLLDDRDGRLISLGPVRPDGTYALPPGVQVGDFPLVDVSIEPPDGDPTHSGNSVLRGPLSA
jgi:hypothetical protein